MAQNVAGHTVNAPTVLSIVIAVEKAAENLDVIWQSLDGRNSQESEVIVCYADDDAATESWVESHETVRACVASAESRIPHMWRDGIKAATGSWVATISAHCVPNASWYDHAIAITESSPSAAAIGGVIVLDESAKARDCAMHLLRYLPYTPPVRSAESPEPAADNALYDRAAILQESDLLETGFWEPSLHARFKAAGRPMRLDTQLLSVHRNRYTVGEFCRQRLAHGREFGRARAVVRPRVQRFTLLLLSPLLPLVFLSKLIVRASRHPIGRRKWLTAMPWLLMYLAVWGLGEATGYFASLTDQSSRKKTQARPPGSRGTAGDAD